MIKYLTMFFNWIIELEKKEYKEDPVCSFVVDALTVISLLAMLFTGATKCMNTALHRDNPPVIEQAAPAASSEQAAPHPESP